MLANQYGGFNFPPKLDMLVEAVTAASPWTILFTLLAICVVYDQGMSINHPAYHSLALASRCKRPATKSKVIGEGFAD